MICQSFYLIWLVDRGLHKKSQPLSEWDGTFNVVCLNCSCKLSVRCYKLKPFIKTCPCETFNPRAASSSQQLSYTNCNVVELQVCRVRKEATRMGCKSPRSLHRNRKVPTTGTGSVLLA